MDAAKGVVSYAVAAQLAADDLVLSTVLADELSTIKAGAALKVDKDTTAVAEIVYKLNGGDLKLAGGIATKLESGQSRSRRRVLRGTHQREFEDERG